MKKIIIALILITLGLTDLFLGFFGIVWLDLSLLAFGLLILGLMIFASILKVFVFAILLLIVVVAALIGANIITLDDFSFYMNETKYYFEEENK